ncbi:MAG: antibiotic biosynthesis monooxygenase [Deltaproteobacteria bacterium]
MNVVRMRIQAGKFELWKERTLETMRSMQAAEGLLEARIIQSGERDVCYVARWTSLEAFAAARPQLVASLDRVRELLESLGELGVTDPVAGPVIFSH